MLFDWRNKTISTFLKLEEKINKIPTPNDIEYNEIAKYLKRKGFKETVGNPPHHVFTYNYNGKIEIINVPEPHGNGDGVKPIYIKKIIEALERIES